MRGTLAPFVVTIALAVEVAPGADQPQWGEAWGRNMTSAETNLPDRFDPATGANIRWSVELGTESHGTPVIAGGRVYTGTNNGRPRDPKHAGDRGVLLCLDERDGGLLWQMVVPKRDEDKYYDWPNTGWSSPATVEGDRVYSVTNRGEVVCLDARGLANGNDGPFTDESARMTPRGETRLALGPLDADILWITDLPAAAGIWPHDGAHSSILIHGDHLYLNTGTGVDNTHKVIRTPRAPSLIVLDKRSGRVLARDDGRMAPDIFHCTWSSPGMGSVEGRDLLFFCGGNGVVHAFPPLPARPDGGAPAILESVWSYDFDPEAPKEDIHSYLRNRLEGPSNIYGMPVFHGGQLFVAGGGDVFWGKTRAWLKCIDPSGRGDVTARATVWSYPLNKHTLTTPAVAGGMVFATDSEGTLHCVDAATGRGLWTHAMSGAFWASPLVADGKVFLGTRKGHFAILRAAREKHLLHSIELGSPVSATATAANGVVYVATMKRLFAVAAARSRDSERAAASSEVRRE